MPRHAGLVLPLFSASSSTSWGIGDIADLPSLGDWLVAARFDRLMILPLGTMPPGQTSPYSATSAMAIDPIYISLPAVEDFVVCGGEASLDSGLRMTLASVRGAPRVRYAEVRRLKESVLDAAFARFMEDEWIERTTRAGAFAGYIARERWWLDEYALFEAIAQGAAGEDWRRWPAALRDRKPHALDEARRSLRDDIRRHQYLQWIAASQWQAARESLRTRGIGMVGDLPFASSFESPDVWSRQAEYRLDVSVGVPPDEFSDSGQDWQLPMYRWDVIAKTDYEWLRRRGRRMAALFDAFRVDHLVGFYRTYGRPADGDPFFSPADETAQVRQGERILTIFQETGAEVLAEDLGVIPPFVRASLERLGVPGFKVIRWERAWTIDGKPYVDPAEYPPNSVVMTGTHDTEAMATWWETAPAADRAAAAAMPGLRARGVRVDTPWTDALVDAWLGLTYAAGSRHLFIPVPDVFGWHDRINTPGLVDDRNWTWRLPWPVDRWADEPEAVERARVCATLAARYNRGRR